MALLGSVSSALVNLIIVTNMRVHNWKCICGVCHLPTGCSQSPLEFQQAQFSVHAASRHVKSVYQQKNLCTIKSQHAKHGIAAPDCLKLLNAVTGRACCVCMCKSKLICRRHYFAKLFPYFCQATKNGHFLEKLPHCTTSLFALHRLVHFFAMNLAGCAVAKNGGQ